MMHKLCQEAEILKNMTHDIMPNRQYIDSRDW